MTTSSKRRRGASSISWVIALVFFLFSFWDFYVPSVGLRPFDIFGFVVLVYALLLTETSGRSPLQRTNGRFELNIALAILFLIPCAIGAIGNPESVKPAIGICLGLIVFTCCLHLKLASGRVVKIVNALILIHSILFCAYVAFYVITGELFNAYAPLGMEVRSYAYGYEFVRFVGAFLEPANYALTLISLLILKFRHQREFDWYIYVGLATIVGSLSFWGLFAAITFLILCKIDNARWFLVFFLTLVLSFLLAYEYGQEWAAAYPSQHPIYRLYNIASDVSAVGRYGAIVEGRSVDTEDIWLGSGVASDYSTLGMNGFSVLVSLFGLVGLLIFFVLITALAGPGSRVFTFGGTLLCLSAAPLVTYFFWWMWLALLLMPSDRDDEPSRIAAFGLSQSMPQQR